MGYTTDSNKVRIDVWKESGKWYTTAQLDWDNYGNSWTKGDELIHETFKRCLAEQFKGVFKNMRVTCLEPNHVNSHPISIIHKG